MKTRDVLPIACAALACLVVPELFAQRAPLAPTPPMGWNSWDSYGTTVTEAQVKANADAMARDLARFGWQYITVDIQWYQPTARGHDYVVGARLSMDDSGRLLPSPNKFPSAANGAGFKPLADYIHAKGLKFGIHIMRGIPRQAVAANAPIPGTPYHARDIADTTNGCRWNPDMWGVDVTKPGGQAYYDAIATLYASWGVDFVKADDMGDHKFQPSEIAALRLALDKTRRPIILSISPGPAPLGQAAFFAEHSQMWRISDDFWDSWRLVRKQFDYTRDWAPYVGVNGGWPDADMLPFGRLRITDSAGRGSPSRLNADEQRTVMTLFSIFRSPLIMGGDLPTMDAPTLALLTNPEVLAVNQGGRGPRQVLDQSGIRVWTSLAPAAADRFVALFNLDTLPRTVSLPWTDVALSNGRHRVRDLWGRKALGDADSLRAELPAHGSVLYRVSAP
ncbi:MAG: glycoside hydrolase family 27 protein [Gemmatimonadota bacterium]